MEIIAVDRDLLTPNDLIDVIFAYDTKKANQKNFSQPESFSGAFRVAEITLSYCVHLVNDDICYNNLATNGLTTDGFSITKGTVRLYKVM